MADQDQLDLLSFFDEAGNVSLEDFQFEELGDISFAADDILDEEEPGPSNEDSHDHLMPHEWFQKLHSTNPEMLEQLFMEDPTLDDELTSNDNNANMTPKADDRLLGWTLKDNEVLKELMFNQLSNVCPIDTGQRVTWRQLTHAYNSATGQRRTKIQLYSHARFCFGIFQRKPSYLKAEEEVILALDELGFPPSMMSPFLTNDRSEHLLATKLQRLKALNSANNRPNDPLQLHFRKRVKEIVTKNGGLAAFMQNEKPKKAIKDIRHLVQTNPNLRKKYLALKQAGRPAKTTKIVPVTQQLKTLFRPFIYVTKRRKRTTCYPGDGRRYGLNLFCLNRILGSPLELSKMPSDKDEAIKAGVSESDYLQYTVLRELMVKHAQKTDSSSSELPKELQEIADLKPGADEEDRRSYYSNPDGPPPVSLLPPTLYTVTGLRGLLCYRETLRSIIAEDGEADRYMKLKDSNQLGDPESDKKLLYLMQSLFQMPFALNDVREDPIDNSDGDSDSDEEACFAPVSPVPAKVAKLEENDVSKPPHAPSTSAESSGVDELLMFFQDEELHFEDVSPLNGLPNGAISDDIREMIEDYDVDNSIKF